MKDTFKAVSLEKCIKEACELLNIEEDKLKYEIIEEKNGFFCKKVTIKVQCSEELNDEKKMRTILDKTDNINNKQDTYDQNDGMVKIENGEVIVTNPIEGGAPACIIIDPSIKVNIDGKQVSGKVEIYEESSIEVFLEKVVPTRHLDISMDNEKMEAYMSLTYTPGNIYTLKDCNENNTVHLEKTLKEQIMPNKYTLAEVKEELSKFGVIYGIIEENISKNVEKDCISVPIAKGDHPLDEKDDIIEYKFPIDECIKKLIEDEKGKVDFKSIGSVQAVKKGDLIAVKIEGAPGKNGKDITGKVKKCKTGKKIKIKTGDGCQLQGNNTIVATIDGKPCVRNNAFYVYQIHEVKSDVDLKTGNIEFVGDIIVYGAVKEGMKILSGNSITIKKQVERSMIKGKGDIIIDGNIITSNIIGGGQDVLKLDYIDDLTKMKDNLKRLMETVEEIKKYDLLGQGRKDGEIIKILIENKFKNLPILCGSIIKNIILIDDVQGEEILLPMIRGKLIGLSPVNIKHYVELQDIINSCSEIMNRVKGELALPVNVKISYCQDSTISSSGDIIVSGKGEYVSNLDANGAIYFTQDKSIARGGELKAKREIKCKTVGSEGGVSTKLIVEKSGHIWADIAYQNTIFIIGQKEYLLERPSKDIHAYIDNKDELIIDKFVL
ncbi:flagellar assembly protein A [Clostridium lundense]|uniref:flagellar assembly protein A n=1 Tax=Clostridium lundense TaxID=319475 RepID=UPI000482413B|nr:flagellar assembly protein A [Clostridium lundense]